MVQGQEQQQMPLDETVQVSQEAGFLCHVNVSTKLDLPPQQSFDIISDPDNARIFRSIEECTYRKVLHDNGRGRKRVAVHHQSGWRFMWHHGKFTTELLVEQDDQARVMAFKLAKPGFMKNFEGFWRMEPYPGQPEATLAVLHQNVLPCVTAPGLNWIFTKITKAQIEAMLEDVKKEVRRIQSGSPIPQDQQKKMEGKRSWREPPVKGFSLDLDDSDADSPRAVAEPPTKSSAGPAESSVKQPEQWELLQAAEHNMVYTPPEQPEPGETAGEHAAGAVS